MKLSILLAIAFFAILASVLLIQVEFEKEGILMLVLVVLSFASGLVTPISSSWAGFVKKFAIAMAVFTIVFGVSFSLQLLDEESFLSDMLLLGTMIALYWGFFGLILGSLLKNVVALIRQKYLTKA